MRNSKPTTSPRRPTQPTRPSRAIHCRSKRCSRWRMSSSTPAIQRSRRRPSNARCACSRRTRRRGWCSGATTCQREAQAAVRGCRARSTWTREPIAPRKRSRCRNGHRSDRSPERLHRQALRAPPQRLQADTTRLRAARAARQKRDRTAPRAAAAARRAGQPRSARRRSSKPNWGAAGRASRTCHSAGGRRGGRSARSYALGEAPAPSTEAARGRGARNRLPPERSTRRTSDSHAGVSATCSIISPAHTTSKPASGELPGTSGVHEPKVQLAVLARARRSGSSATSTPTAARPARASSAVNRASPQPTSSTRARPADGCLAERRAGSETVRRLIQPAENARQRLFVVSASRH